MKELQISQTPTESLRDLCWFKQQRELQIEMHITVFSDPHIELEYIVSGNEKKM